MECDELDILMDEISFENSISIFFEYYDKSYIEEYSEESDLDNLTLEK
jgi:hypothetical protein